MTITLDQVQSLQTENKTLDDVHAIGQFARNLHFSNTGMPVWVQHNRASTVSLVGGQVSRDNYVFHCTISFSKFPAITSRWISLVPS